MVAGVLRDSVAEVIYHRRDGKDATQRFVDTFLLRMDFFRPKRRSRLTQRGSGQPPIFAASMSLVKMTRMTQSRSLPIDDTTGTYHYLAKHRDKLPTKHLIGRARTQSNRQIYPVVSKYA